MHDTRLSENVSLSVHGREFKVPRCGRKDEDGGLRSVEKMAYFLCQTVGKSEPTWQ